ncbi:MAG: hypothetical protein Q9217_004900 [Psora testacea]
MTTDEWQTSQRAYKRTSSIFIKRELRREERHLDFWGNPICPQWSKQRLQNEKAALEYIATHTSIPVPRVLDCFELEGAYHLITKLVPGVPLDHIEAEDKPRALRQVDAFIRDCVLPQLHTLKSRRIGSLIGFVIPPTRVIERDNREFWLNKSSSKDQYVFCHNDLAQHNIMVDPETLQVVAILDWESSGFYPPDFEAPLWLRPYYERVDDAAEIDRLIEFLVGLGERQEVAPVVLR